MYEVFATGWVGRLHRVGVPIAPEVSRFRNVTQKTTSRCGETSQRDKRRRCFVACCVKMKNVLIKYGLSGLVAGPVLAPEMRQCCYQLTMLSALLTSVLLGFFIFK